MVLLDLITGNFKDVFIYITLTFSVFVLVFIAVLVDLYFGIQKSKKNGSFVHSYGLKRTISKTLEYMAMVFMFFLIDFLNPMWFILTFPKVPILSIIAGIIIIVIEWISVKESFAKKTISAIAETPKDVMRYIIDNRRFIKEIISDMDEIETKKELRKQRKQSRK